MTVISSVGAELGVKVSVVCSTTKVGVTVGNSEGVVVVTTVVGLSFVVGDSVDKLTTTGTRVGDSVDALLGDVVFVFDEGNADGSYVGFTEGDTEGIEVVNDALD